MAFGPSCSVNRDYARRLRHSFVLGQSPPGFPENDMESEFINKSSINDLTKVGRNSMDFLPLHDVVLP